MMGETMPIVPRVDVDEICGIGARKPLLLWLSGTDPEATTRLVDSMKQSYFKPDAHWDSFVWGMLRLCGKLGDGRLFMFEGLRLQGHRRRLDLDVPADVARRTSSISRSTASTSLGGSPLRMLCCLGGPSSCPR